MLGRTMALGIFFAAAASPAPAATWRVSSASGDVVAYIDTDAIRRKGDEVWFWRELRWPEPQGLENGLRFDRMAALFKANCRAMTYISLRNRVNLGDRVLFNGKDSNDEVHAAEPGSNGEADLRAACFGEWKTGE